MVIMTKPPIVSQFFQLIATVILTNIIAYILERNKAGQYFRFPHREVARRARKTPMKLMSVKMSDKGTPYTSGSHSGPQTYNKLFP